uniref:Putative secreted protein n=1 Tax=Ixodes ricinus TaxID=34613 RepID=A0A6B0UI25_IXORI
MGALSFTSRTPTSSTAWAALWGPPASLSASTTSRYALTSSRSNGLPTVRTTPDVGPISNMSLGLRMRKETCSLSDVPSTLTTVTTRASVAFSEMKAS